MKEILASFQRLSLVVMLGWRDIRSRYRRSIIGPFWLTISMGVMVASIGFVFGQIFQAPMNEYLPSLAAGIILWTFIAGTLNEGCTAFIDAEAIIKQNRIPLFVYVLRVLWRNLLILGHNILILPLVWLVLGKKIELGALLAIPGLLLVAICLSGIALLLALLCTRYRDLAQIVASALQIAFYVTPIIWIPSALPNRVGASFVQLNPFYHLLELVRAPLLDTAPTVTSWLVVSGLALIVWGLAAYVLSKLVNRIAYWL